MFGNNSVDALATVILTDIKNGIADQNMLKRFYRRGKRDARRLGYEPSREFVIHAVALANSKICEEYVAEREKALDVRASLVGKIEQIQGVIEQMGPDIKPVGLTKTSTLDKDGSTPGSLARLAEIREQQRVQKAYDERQAAVSHLADVTRQLKTADDGLISLPSQFEQSATSCREVGNLLWARYCMGFERGKRRRVAPDSSLDGPPSELAFEVPCVFTAPIPVPNLEPDGTT